MVLRTVNQEITKPQLIRNSHDVSSKFLSKVYQSVTARAVTKVAPDLVTKVGRVFCDA